MANESGDTRVTRSNTDRPEAEAGAGAEPRAEPRAEAATEAETFGRLFRRPVVRLSMALHVLLAIALCFVPLFDSLGFERAFATGILSTITSVLIGVEVAHRSRLRQCLLVAMQRSFLLGVIMLVPSLIAGWVFETLTIACDRTSGVLFLLLCAGGNTLFATGVGIAMGARFERRWSAGLAAFAAILGLLVMSLYRLYSEPQIFLYNHALGYWPGSIYDEALSVSTTLWAFRASTVLFTVAIVSAAAAFGARGASKPNNRRGRLGVALASLAVAVWLQSRGEEAGFDRDRNTVMNALSRKIETPEFEIFVDPTVTPEALEHIKQDHAFRYQQLQAYFHITPKQRIRSFVYRDERQKTMLMGAANTQISRPWAHEIHIHGFDYPHPTLKHELAHVFAGEMATGLFKVPATAQILVNIGVVEGIAVAADWPAYELTVHEWTRAMRALELAPDPRNSLSVFGFWSISSARAYTVAGSFIRYLVDRYGIDAFRTLYQRNDFEAAYGRSLDDLASEWAEFIDRIELSDRSKMIAEHRFSRPGIFQKTCARHTANILARGYRRLGNGDIEGAASDLETAFGYAPSDGAPLIALSQALAERGHFDAATALAERAVALPGATAKGIASAREALAIIAWRSGKDQEARTQFEALGDLHLSASHVRLCAARVAALTLDPGIRDPLMRYLAGDFARNRNQEQALASLAELGCAHPNQPLVRYLLGLRLAQAGLWDSARGHLEAALAATGDLRLGVFHRLGDFHDGGPALRRNAEMFRARALLETGHPHDAVEAFRRLAQDAPSEADRLDAEDWQARAQFVALGSR
ncbi:MAG: hypothetical protein IPK13_02900 [Deltaproteobacteria bacterium]|nr:hypothetical protein [Deltaproteobacteria bacterium]